MMTAQRLVGLAERLEWDALLDAVIRNGRPVPISVRMRLSRDPGAGACAVGLALCRAVELTYLPGAESHALAILTLANHLEDGSFGSIAGSSCAAAGLRAYEEQLRAGLGDTSAIARVAEASDRGVQAVMAHLMSDDAEPVDLAIALWVLSGRLRASESWWTMELRARGVDLGLAHDASLSTIVIPALVRSEAGGIGVAA